MGSDDMDQPVPIVALGLEAGETSASATDRSTIVEELYAAYRMPVYRYLRSRTASDDEAADLTATTFEHALVAIDRLRPDGQPLAWLLRIARNAAIDTARRRRPTGRLEDIAERDQPVSEESPEQTVLEAERSEELRALVRALPDAQRDAVALRYAAGLSAREIGHVIGKSEAASQKLIQRALVALKEARHVDR
jgi:RNA polymerase sigma factor (sigma-70 family)